MYSTPDAVRLAADPDWRPGSPEPDAASQSAASLTDAQLQDAIAEASTLIDLYLGARYTTPVAPVDASADPLTYPDPVGYWARDIALYLATLTWLRHVTLEANDPVALRYAAAIGQLTAVRDGKATVPLPSSTDTTSGGFAGVVDPGMVGLFDASDAGFHAAGVGTAGRMTWNEGGWLYG